MNDDVAEVKGYDELLRLNNRFTGIIRAKRHKPSTR